MSRTVLRDAGEGDSYLFHEAMIKRRDARGGVLLGVLVILVLVGMMSYQGMRLFYVIARSHHQQLKIEQAEELLELGRMRLAQRKDQDNDELLREGKTQFVVSMRGDASEPAGEGHVLIERASEPEGDRWRIVARYPYRLSGEVVSSWEGQP